MAARDRLGGIADSTRAGVVILAAAFDRVFVETVGVGQSEADVAGLVDTLVFVGHPDAGDALQSMKAGILEIPDLFVINKSDVGAAAKRAASDLAAGLELSVRDGSEPRPQVLVASAREGHGIAELIAAMDAHREHQLAHGGLSARRQRGREAFVLETLASRYGSYGIQSLGGRDALRARIGRDAQMTSFALAAALGREIEEALHKPI
jgi:LAO/AO transport system kinase